VWRGHAILVWSHVGKRSGVLVPFRRIVGLVSGKLGKERLLEGGQCAARSRAGEETPGRQRGLRGGNTQDRYG
jgi:hypothetical protein